MDYESFLELAKNRRSIRDFKTDPIPDDFVGKIIEAARWAPSGFNSQPWEFVFVKKQELKESVVMLVAEARGPGPKNEPTKEKPPGLPTGPPAHRTPMGYANAPVFILLFGDPRVREWGPPLVKSNDEKWKSVFTSSLALAFQYMHMAATSLGLGSQWVSAVNNPKAHTRIKELLGIPIFMEIYDMMAVGYPAIEPREKQMRAREDMVHYDDCGEDAFRTDEEVKEYFSKK
jgi:nitroreductase